MEQQEGCPEEGKLIATPMEGETAEYENREGVGGNVGKPEKHAEDAGAVPFAEAREQEEEDLQGEAGHHHALELPLVKEFLGT